MDFAPPPEIIFQGFGYTIIPILIYLEEDSSGTWLEIRHLNEAQHFEERGKKGRSVYFIFVVYDRPSKEGSITKLEFWEAGSEI